ncbi:MAG: hypothetical protein ABI625_09175 [bacterium]
MIRRSPIVIELDHEDCKRLVVEVEDPDAVVAVPQEAIKEFTR